MARKTAIVAMAACLLTAAAVHAAQGLSVKSEAKPEKAPAIDITRADDGNTVAVPLGRNARIRLAGNPTTGYSWFLAGIDGNSVAAEGEVTYAPKPRAPGIVGGGGVFELLLRTAKAGKSTVRMEYKRPWEKDTPPIETFRVAVEVKEVKAATAVGALRAPTKPLAERVREAETVFLGKVVNRVVDGDWARAELLVEEPLSSAQKGAKVAVTWRIKVGTFFIYDVEAGTRGVAILKDKHEGRYWLRADKFENPEKLAEVKALVTEKSAGTPAEEPIAAIKVVPERSVFTDSAWDKPIVIKSDTDAAKHFGKDALKTLETAVDFKKQFVLVFAWRGSGGDELSYNVAESYPEQIFFSLKRGRTRDLREHTHVYALRSNVRWRVEGTAGSPAKSVAQAIEAKDLEVTVTPAKPYVLPDGKTKIVVKKESIYLGRGGQTGTVQVMVGDSVLEVIPPTVIAANGYRFEFRTDPRFQFGEVRQEDMIFTVVDSCTFTVLSSGQPSPQVALKELKGTVELDCHHNMPCLEAHTIRGEGNHFVSFKPTMVEVARFHPQTVLAARLKMNVVNNFGAKAITLDYMKKTQVTIGQETITFESFDFNYAAKKLRIRITTAPAMAKAAVTVLEYGGKPTKLQSDDSGEFIRVKADGKYADAKLPIEALGKGEAVEVQVKGKLTDGIMAIGGETTGTTIKARNVTWELDVSGPGLKAKAAKLNGKTVVVTGAVRQKAGIEIAKRTILVAKTLEEG